MYISFSYKLSKLLNSSNLLDEKVKYRHPLLSFKYKCKGLVCWKKHREKAIKYSKKHNIPLIQLEDAFIGYIENSNCQMVNIGYYFDESGKTYYQATEDNIITQTLANKSYKKQDLQEAGNLIDKIVSHRISKYNFLQFDPFSPSSDSAPILLLDQVVQDASLTSNNHGKKDFQAMYEKALSMANGKKIYIKTHPMGKGYLEKIYNKNEAILITGKQNIFDILEHVEHVFTLSSQAGFEALLAKKTVHVFGMPFYAGYGLTIDYTKIKRQKTSLEELFYAAYIKACKYHIAGVKCSLDEIIDVVLTHKALTKEDKKTERFFLYNIPMWKTPSILNFIFKTKQPRSSHSIVHRVNSIRQLKRHMPTQKDAVIVWGFKGEQDKLKNYTENNKIKTITFEDGFIRSVGLGSDFIPPYSFVLDEHGIYYNPQHKSQLEHLLQTEELDEENNNRTQKLLHDLYHLRITKYNIGSNLTAELKSQIYESAGHKKIILIPGQVSDDMSLLKGGTIFGNYRDLVPQIRKENPDAFIIYKHHPDVVAGNRKGYISSHILKQHVNLIIKDVNIVELIALADEIHTITSIAGFEALLYKKQVFHYGLPFYGGYGFTQDKSNIKHKRKKINFNKFAYILFFKYPRYTKSGLNIALTPEVIVKLIKQQQDCSIHHKKRYKFSRKIYQLIRVLILLLQR